MLPRITLITPSYQQAQYLPDCLRSVAEQGYPDLEHLVVDGGSTDGSREIIERHADRLAWWCSEGDGGQSAAINKGLAHATGHVFGWLNSDDLLQPGALQAVGEAFAADPDLLVYTATRIRRHPDGRDERLEADDPSDPEAWLVRPRVHQSSTFYRLDAVRDLGGLEEKLHHVMDLELWWQLLLRHGTGHVRVVDRPLSVFRLHAGSKTVRSLPAFVDETAGLLHGMCLRTGDHASARALATGHHLPKGLRPMPVGPADAAIVRRMTLRFLLHWNRVIFTERQFRMMRLLRDTAAPAPEELTAEQRAAWQGLQRQLAVPGWWAFRLRRKLTHWRVGRQE